MVPAARPVVGPNAPYRSHALPGGPVVKPRVVSIDLPTFMSDDEDEGTARPPVAAPPSAWQPEFMSQGDSMKALHDLLSSADMTDVDTSAPPPKDLLVTLLPHQVRSIGCELC